MLTKDKTVGQGSYKVTKKVIDWEAVGGAIVIGMIAIVIIANL